MLNQLDGTDNLALLLNVSPDWVVWFTPITDATGAVTDFGVSYSNVPTGQSITLLPVAKGASLLDGCATDPDRQHFAGPLRNVLSTGAPYGQTLRDTLTDRWYQTTATRLGEGVLVVLHHLPDYRPPVSSPPTQALLADLIDNVQIGLLLLEPVRNEAGDIVDLVYTLANDKAVEILGRTRANTVGRTLLEMYPGSDTFAFPGTTTGESMLGRYVRQLREGGSLSYEFLYDRDGLNSWFQTTAQPLPDRKSIVISFTDITASKEAEHTRQQLLETNEQQRALLQGILDATQNIISVHEPIRNTAGEVQDFRITLVNRAGQHLIDRLRVDISGQTLRDLLPSTTYSGIFDNYKRVVATGKSIQFDSYVDELAMWVRITAATMGDNIVVTCLDVTKSRRVMLDHERQATFLQNLIEASPNGIMVERAIRDENGQIVDFLILSANQRAATIVRSSVDRMVGQRDLELHPGLRDSGNFDRYVEAVETGVHQQIETHYVDSRLDFWVSVDVRRIAEDELVITFSDISALKLAVQENQQQTELLINVLDASTNGIMSFTSVRDETGGLVDFTCLIGNKAASRLVGRPVEALVGARLLNLFPQVTALGLFDQYVHTVETGEPTNTEFHIVHQGQDVFWTISARRLKDGFVVTFADVTELRLATRVIEASINRLQTVIDQSQTAIALLAPIYNATGEIVNFRYNLVNQTLADYFSKAPTDLIGSPVSDWFTGFQENGYSFIKYRDVFRTGQPVRFDLHYEYGGMDMWLDVMATRMDDEVLISFSNYTSLKHTQQQLEDSIADLQRSNRNLEQFAYVASHDLQEPLRKIQSFGNMLQQQYQPELGEDGAMMLDRMQSAASRMQTLIRDVLAYSRLATQRDATRPVALQTLLNELRNDLEMTIADQQASLHVDSLPVVSGDAAQLRQLFQNLITNALKFTRPDVPPVITINSRTVAGRDAGQPVSPADEGRPFHQITVTDNGIGFAPEHADRIFQVFQRLHGRNQYTGTGIGLAIVEKVVANHRGYIRAEGRPGEGATFRLLLPA